MSANVDPWVIDQGATFTRTIEYQDSTGAPVNLTGYTALLQIRRAPGDTEAPRAQLSNGSGIALGADGVVTVTFAASMTAAWTFAHGAFDLLLTSPGGYSIRLVQGLVEVSPAVSHA